MFMVENLSGALRVCAFLLQSTEKSSIEHLQSCSGTYTVSLASADQISVDINGVLATSLVQTLQLYKQQKES